MLTEEPTTAETSPRAVGAPHRRDRVPRTMRALRLVAPRRIVVDDVAVPEPGLGQVLVRLEGCGVCGSNLPLWQGQPWFDYPRPAGTPGHEGWGTVEQVGGEVREVAVGTRVSLLSSSAYAQFDIADATAITPLPPGHDIFPGEALGCAVNAFERSLIESHHTVAIVGIGFMGALLTQLSAATGARVIALSRRPFALDMARRCGAAEAVRLARSADAAGAAMSFTGGKGFDRVIEAAGAQESLDLASALVAVRGRLIIAGYHQDSTRVVDMQLWNWRGIDVINAHERDPAQVVHGMAAAARLVAAGTLAPDPLYTHAFDLEQSADAFSHLEQRPEGFLKAWIRTNA